MTWLNVTVILTTYATYMNFVLENFDCQQKKNADDTKCRILEIGDVYTYAFCKERCETLTECKAYDFNENRPKKPKYCILYAEKCTTLLNIEHGEYCDKIK